MSHMLATVNAAAAEAIDNPVAPPDIATWVIFKGRAGFSRMHRTEFPAMVLGSHPEDGSLTLMVVMEPEDMMMETRVPFQSHNQEHFCWRYRRPGKAEMEAGDEGVAARLKKIEDYLAGEDAVGEAIEVLQNRLATAESVLMNDEIEQLDKRIAALEKKPKKEK